MGVGDPSKGRPSHTYQLSPYGQHGCRTRLTIIKEARPDSINEVNHDLHILHDVDLRAGRCVRALRGRCRQASAFPQLCGLQRGADPPAGQHRDLPLLHRQGRRGGGAQAALTGREGGKSCEPPCDRIASSEFFTSEAEPLAWIEFHYHKLKAGRAARSFGTGFAFVVGNNNLTIRSGGVMSFTSCRSALLLLGTVYIVGLLEAAPAFSETLVDTGAGGTEFVGSPALFGYSDPGYFQYWAGQFTLTDAYTFESVSGWMGGM